MLESALNLNPGLPEAPAPRAAARKVLQMRPDPDGRMAGSVPVWITERGPVAEIETNLAQADRPRNFATVLALAQGGAAPGKNESFGFGDVIDIVNPLQHIPLVGSLYRAVTGDEIKPSGRVLGGALFGGFAGAAMGMVNIIAEEETGRDVPGNLVAMLEDEEPPQMAALSPAAQDAQFNDLLRQWAPEKTTPPQTPAPDVPAEIMQPELQKLVMAVEAPAETPVAAGTVREHGRMFAIRSEDRMGHRISAVPVIERPVTAADLPTAAFLPGAYRQPGSRKG